MPFPMGNLRALLRLLACLLLAVLASGHAYAREVPLQACVARQQAGESVDAVLRHQPMFTCDSAQSRLGSGDFITELRFVPVRAQTGDPLVLRTSNVWQDSARIHFRYADGVEYLLDYSSHDAARYLTIGAIMEFPLPPRSQTLQAIIIETRGSANLRGVVLGAKLMPASEAYRLKTALTALYASFGGLALALIIYNISLWAALRNRFQLYYASMVTALAAYTFTSSGAISMLAPWIDSNSRLRINYILLTLAGLTALHFIRKFFDDEICGPRLMRWIRGFGALAMAAALAFAVLSPWLIWWTDRLYFIGMAGMLCMAFPLLYSAWRHKSSYFGLFALAWSAPILTSILRAAHGFGLIGYSFLLDNSNLVAFAFEAVLSALLVNARLRQLTMERDTALAGEQYARRLANTDSLTGLLNRRAFLDLAIGRRSRQRLMLIDLDHFKMVNDRLGHEAGDQVLSEVAGVLQKCRPGRSLAVRLGGEEFALLVPRSQIDQCMPDMVLEAVRNHAMPQGMQVTVSIGIAEGPVASEEDWKRLYRLADAALYRAKADGRNRACRATDFRAVA